MTKTYLFPGPVREAHDACSFVVRDTSGHWLGTYHKRNPWSKGWGAVQRFRITPELYRSFVTEAHHNAARYAGK